MNEFNIIFNLESPQKKDTNIKITIENEPKEDLLFKYIVGYNGVWNTIQDFSKKKFIQWIPKKNGRYIIMVQAKKENSIKGFDYVSKADYIIGEIEEKLINNLYLDKSKLELGEKININVQSSKVSVMFRYWIKELDKWKLVKDYSADNTLTFTTQVPGKHQVLVECKNIDSKSNFDDFEKKEFEVTAIEKPEIINFQCLNSDILINSELIFQVDAKFNFDRTILYKFIKINSNGICSCIQDYSTKRIVSYIEDESGEYKLLCMVKDMYSQSEFDDRAIINFKVKKYKDIVIKSFTTDLVSPQISGTFVNLRAIVEGGSELLYKFKVDGQYSEDSGYIREMNYLWKTKEPGEYKITLWVKDVSFDGNYEAEKSFNFIVDEKSSDPVSIDDILVDKKERALKNEPIKVKVSASGGIDLKYRFIITLNGKQIEKLEYGDCNWIEFIPKCAGNYKLEVKVKDKYSTRKFDNHSITYINVYDYIPACIDYILLPPREYYICGDKVFIDIVTRNGSSVLINYVLKINGHKVEETGFVKSKKYIFTPKYSGVYTVEMYAKNLNSEKIFDCKRTLKVKVYECLPVTNTKIKCDKVNVICNDSVTFTAECDGGKDILYEFYIMEKGEWNLVQNYSRKKYYTFIPFSEGKFKVLLLCKSQYSKKSYEDYDIMEIDVCN
ncbi:hypothetical protein CLOACE_11330 [Clostridium acetireducens DSM 10703]|jgi:hypothetical protein|uniref:Two component regulator three Y domain-containing protein n=1 Tax=Clostridium acetireducens DSM 10703 TaxID=1121290 RepID=A0A1E8EYY8_9CLOT|nr:triple tyrosine motif-containing protein [Clostridium acetireducens]OFI06234.1 hypothetical protein CLOACE_11330 [Clostridium acetireducens DSM 10703]